MRVLSYNIHKGIGGRDRRYKLERIIQVIEHENPDFICLQEVDREVKRSRFQKQADLLAEYFKVEGSFFQLNVKIKTGGYGNLILSRWPFQTHHQISLRLNKKKPRGAQLVTVDTPEGMLHLVNWHLGLTDRERQWQVQKLLEHRLFQEAADLPTLIIGDTNDWLNKLATACFEEAGFEHITRPASRFRTFPAWMPVNPLDKAYYRGPFLIREARIVRTPMAKVASDHLPLVMDFHINRDPTGSGLDLG